MTPPRMRLLIKKGRKNMKKLISIILLTMALAVCLSACGGSSEPAPEPAEEPTESHIYDNAVVIDMMNGPRTEKIGEYSVIEAPSTDITEDVLNDWFYNYIEKTDYSFYIISFTDKPGFGVHGMNTMITVNAGLNVDENGDYSVISGENEQYYSPGNDGTLHEINW